MSTKDDDARRALLLGLGGEDLSVELALDEERYGQGTPIGAGGMGVVDELRDLHLERVVARKRIRGGKVSTAAVRRFLEEARVTGSLEHPNVVPVYDLGVDDDGHPWFTMRRIEGDTLRQRLDDGSMSLLERVDVFRKVADALAYAHQQGVLHRDLKPDNVLIGDFGQVFVADWGLAHADEADAPPGPETIAGIGSPAWMAPEQAHGERPTDATDVYGLGALLYALLSGRSPRQGDPEQLMEQAGRGHVDPLTEGPRELRAIALHALQADRSARYPSVQALIDDVERWRAGDEVAAATYSPVQRGYKLFRRNRRTVILTVAAVIAAALGVASSTFVYVQSLDRARQNAEDARDATRTQLAETHLALAEAEIRAGRWPRAARHLDDAMAQGDLDPRRAAILRAWLAPRLATARHTGPEAGPARLSPDGTQLAVKDGDGSVRVVELASGRTITSHDGIQSPVAWVGNELRGLRLDGERLSAVPIEQSTAAVPNVQWEGGALAVEVDEHFRPLRVWRDGQPIEAVPTGVTRGRIAADRMLLTPTERPHQAALTALLWDVSAAGVVAEVEGNTPMTLTHGGAGLCLVKEQHIRCSLEGRPTWELPTPHGLVSLSSRGSHLYAVTDRGQVVAYDAETGREMWTLAVDGKVRDMRGDIVVLGGDGGWKVVEGSPAARVETGHRVVTVTPDQSGDGYLTAGWDGTARHYDLATGSRLATLLGSPTGARSAAANAYGAWVSDRSGALTHYTPSRDPRVMARDGVKAQRVVPMESGDVLVLYSDGVLVEWTVEGTRVRTIDLPLDSGWDLVVRGATAWVSGRGRRDAVAAEVDLITGHAEAYPQVLDAYGMDASDEWVVAGTHQGLWIHDRRTKEERLVGQTGVTLSAAVAPWPDTVVAATYTGELVWFDLPSGDRLASLPLGTVGITDVAVVGTKVLAADGDGVVHTIELGPEPR